jgi:hypothetical protein
MNKGAAHKNWSKATVPIFHRDTKQTQNIAFSIQKQGMLEKQTQFPSF